MNKDQFKKDVEAAIDYLKPFANEEVLIVDGMTQEDIDAEQNRINVNKASLKALKLTLFLLNHHNDTEELLILAERCEDGRQNMTVDELEKRLSE